VFLLAANPSIGCQIKQLYMAYTYSIIENIVRNNVNDASANVQQEIDDAINLLSNFFTQKKIDTSISTVNGQAYINMPSNAVEIMKIKIDSDHYTEKRLSEIKDNEEAESKCFYEWDGKIQIIPTPTGVSSAKIWYLGGFTPLAGTGSTDVPDRLVPVLCVLATWLYYVQLVAKNAVNRENLPDITPDEIRELSKHWKKTFDEMVISIQNQRH
jgi:hypothetical protein